MDSAELCNDGNRLPGAYVEGASLLGVRSQALFGSLHRFCSDWRRIIRTFCKAVDALGIGVILKQELT